MKIRFVHCIFQPLTGFAANRIINCRKNIRDLFPETRICHLTFTKPAYGKDIGHAEGGIFVYHLLVVDDEEKIRAIIAEIGEKVDSKSK